MSVIQERLNALRTLMKENHVQAYIVPTSDYHDTEYVAEYFQVRRFLSGFTGSQGTLIVLADQAALWADGRYFIQAQQQLAGTGIDLMRMGQPGVPTQNAYLIEHLKPGDTVGFDGKVMSAAACARMKDVLALHHIQINPDLDLAAGIWKDRPLLKAAPTFHYDEKYNGRTIGQKLEQVRQAMAEQGAASHVINKIDEIAWLYNLRAGDIPNFPVALAYTIIQPEKAILYLDDSRLDEESRKLFAENNVEVRGYHDIYEDIRHLEGTVLMDPDYMNFRLYSSIPAENIIAGRDPIVAMKAIKNEVELENTRHAHIKDGTAVTKFMHWLKTQVGQTEMSELSAQKYLNDLRRQQDLYLQDSFNTICAYKDHAAMMHYSSTPESDVPLAKEGMLLVDSGGHYLDGTTDITRTFVLGPISEEEKFWFTKALQSHIRLQQAKFLYGCRGCTLDVLAREPLWKLSMDYQCGTGHGVGHLLSVHEPPNGFRWQIVPERDDSCILEEGMIQSNEPGVYEAGKFGIRHENELIVRKADANQYGQFMEFENLTFVPFDLDGIDPSLLDAGDIQWLNEYHQQVYDKIAPNLSEEEAAWLKTATRPIQ